MSQFSPLLRLWLRLPAISLAERSPHPSKWQHGIFQTWAAGERQKWEKDEGNIENPFIGQCVFFPLFFCSNTFTFSSSWQLKPTGALVSDWLCVRLCFTVHYVTLSQSSQTALQEMKVLHDSSHSHTHVCGFQIILLNFSRQKNPNNVLLFLHTFKTLILQQLWQESGGVASLQMTTACRATVTNWYSNISFN